MRAGVTTRMSALGRTLGDLACAAAVAGEIPSVGADTPLTVGICLAGPVLGSAGGAWLGDGIGDAIFNPQPTPSWQPCAGTDNKRMCGVTVPIHSSVTRMNESQSTHKVLSNSPKRVWWLRPLVGTLGLGSLVAACGGPANIIDLAVPQALAIAAGVSAFIGALLVLWFLWKPFNLSPGLHSGLGVGTSVILGLTLRQIMSNEPVLGSIMFGAIGGYCVAASLLPSKLHPTVW